MSQHRKNSVRGKVIGKKWFVRIGCLKAYNRVGQREPLPENLVRYSFIIKGKVGREKKTTFILTLRHTSSFHQRVFLSLHGQAKTVMALWKNYFRSRYKRVFSLKCDLCINSCFFYVSREHVLGVMNLLSSPGRMWSQATIVFLFGGASHSFVEWFFR